MWKATKCHKLSWEKRVSSYAWCQSKNDIQPISQRVLPNLLVLGPFQNVTLAPSHSCHLSMKEYCQALRLTYLYLHHGCLATKKSLFYVLYSISFASHSIGYEIEKSMLGRWIRTQFGLKLWTQGHDYWHSVSCCRRCRSRCQRRHRRRRRCHRRSVIVCQDLDGNFEAVRFQKSQNHFYALKLAQNVSEGPIL